MKLQIDKLTDFRFKKTDFYKDFILNGYIYGGLESNWCNRLTIFKR